MFTKAEHYLITKHTTKVFKIFIFAKTTKSNFVVHKIQEKRLVSNILELLQLTECYGIGWGWLCPN